MEKRGKVPSKRFKLLIKHTKRLLVCWRLYGLKSKERRKRNSRLRLQSLLLMPRWR